ncbi:GGDEF domain-containing protein [Marinobacter sp. JSM 1782161]|uniref:GGDEF domain-containing protein n=1 Tax=Marinobacter sp. JSM 1782161 TaxID=2685906 RepID=UPI001401F6E0|nr:GGDEF domain-containing protein [Marinobacter sp. JSM 1782161]
MTETRLRTLTHSLGYSLTALFMAGLAVQNLRYGFYDLFYLALALAVASVTGTAYTLLMRRRQLFAPGHILVLSAMNLLAVAAVFSSPHPDVSHWTLALILLNLLILPLRAALTITLSLVGCVGFWLFLATTPAQAVITLGGIVMLTGAAGFYSWRYRHMAQSAEDLSITDHQTGAHNARFLDETLQKEISRAQATGNTLSVIQVHLDHLDEAVELHGRDPVAELMREITETLFGVIRAGDTLYSLNNRDFFLVLPFTPEEGVRVIAERVRRTLGETEWPIVGRLTATLGCTAWHASDATSHHLRDRAEAAMREAQRRGSDRAWFIAGSSNAA